MCVTASEDCLTSYYTHRGLFRRYFAIIGCSCCSPRCSSSCSYKIRCVAARGCRRLSLHLLGSVYFCERGSCQESIFTQPIGETLGPLSAWPAESILLLLRSTNFSVRGITQSNAHRRCIQKVGAASCGVKVLRRQMVSRGAPEKRLLLNQLTNVQHVSASPPLLNRIQGGSVAEDRRTDLSLFCPLSNE